MNNATIAPGIIPPGQTLPPMLSDAEKARKAGERGGSKPKDRRHTRDRFGVLNAFIDCTAAGLGRADVLVWLVLFRDTRDGTARTAHADIARRAGIAQRNVVRAVGRLKRLGLVQVVYRGGLNRGPSRYRVYPLERLGTDDAGVTGTGDISIPKLVTRASYFP